MMKLEASGDYERGKSKLNRNHTDHFRHLLITKFNICFTDWNKRDNSSSFGSAEWMEHRLQLFDRYCFPSIRNQTNTKFKWLILMDHGTRVDHRKRMQEYKCSFENVELIYTSEYNLIRDVENYIEHDEERDFLITTRIDNDDAYREDAIDVIQSCFTKQEFQFLNFQKGYQYSIANSHLYLIEDSSSPFMTLIEKKRAKIKTVLFEEHQLISGKWPLRQLGDGRYWLQVIHGRNVANVLRSGRSAWLRYFLRTVVRSPQNVTDLVTAVLRKNAILTDFNVKI
jgi:Putative rhamnosyl transferase